MPAFKSVRELWAGLPRDEPAGSENRSFGLAREFFARPGAGLSPTGASPSVFFAAPNPTRLKVRTISRSHAGQCSRNLSSRTTSLRNTVEGNSILVRMFDEKCGSQRTARSNVTRGPVGWVLTQASRR